ncbi:MAG: polysaccharide deacetylase family protein [Vulcanimicrobiaceae bacterium]
MLVSLLTWARWPAALLQAVLLAALALGPARAATLHERLVPEPFAEIAVLLFHQVSYHPIESAHGVDHVQKPWTSPAAFDRFLSELNTDGYHVIPLSLALDFFEGKVAAADLPPHPALLTFDDGFLTALTVATPILRKHGDVATMFFEGHATDNPAIPGRLTRADLRSMAKSGTWTIESHGFAGHSDLQIDAKGTLSPYWYANLAWLPGKHRLETKAEFEARVQNDLRKMRTMFQPVIGAPIRAFAYPSGEYGQNAALTPGADPTTRIEAGHSNAHGLTPLIVEALKNAGYRAAFAVSLPGAAHFAQRSDSIWALPRLGVGANFRESELPALAGTGDEFPEIADGHYADVGPLCSHDGDLLAAATNRPVIFTLNRNGRLLGQQAFPALIADRPSGSAAISGLTCDAAQMWAVQKAGFDPHPQPYLDTFSLGAGRITLLSHTPLPSALNWLVGLTMDGGTLYGISDHGSVFNVTTGMKLFELDPSIAASARQNRFAGLATHDGALYTFDTRAKAVVAFDATGTIEDRIPVDASLRDLAFDGTTLYASNWLKARRSLHVYHLLEEAP